MKRSLGTLAALAVATLVITAPAQGEEPTRDSYVAEIESICKRDTERSQIILKGAQERIKAQKLIPAGNQFLRVSETFGEAIRKIVAVPRPAADDARLSKWFEFLRIVKVRFRQLGKTLKEEERVKATHASIKLERSANAANNVGFVFGFHNCRLTRSRFG
jgi:hypothetical protein